MGRKNAKSAVVAVWLLAHLAGPLRRSWMALRRREYEQAQSCRAQIGSAEAIADSVSNLRGLHVSSVSGAWSN